MVKPVKHTRMQPKMNTPEKDPASAEEIVDAPVEQPADAQQEPEAPAEETTSEPEAPVTEVAEPAPAQEPEAPAVEVTEPVPVSAESAPVMTEEEEFLAKAAASGTPLQKQILQAVTIFDREMTPRRPATEDAIIRTQNNFLDWMLRVLNSPPDEFKKAWAILLLYFKVYHGNANSPSSYSSLSEYRSNCFVDRWADGDRVALYVDLMTVLRATRNQKTRKHDIKRIDLSKIGDGQLTEKQLSNLKLFYEV